MSRVLLLATVASALSGCALLDDTESLTARDSGRVDLTGGDWITSGFEILADGASVEVEVSATGQGVDVGVIRWQDYEAWAKDDPDVVLYCAVFETRLFEQSCVFDRGEWALTVWNPHETRSMVSWAWEIPPLEA